MFSAGGRCGVSAAAEENSSVLPDGLNAAAQLNEPNWKAQGRGGWKVEEGEKSRQRQFRKKVI